MLMFLTVVNMHLNKDVIHLHNIVMTILIEESHLDVIVMTQTSMHDILPTIATTDMIDNNIHYHNSEATMAAMTYIRNHLDIITTIMINVVLQFPLVHPIPVATTGNHTHVALMNLGVNRKRTKHRHDHYIWNEMTMTFVINDETIETILKDFVAKKTVAVVVASRVMILRNGVKTIEVPAGTTVVQGRMTPVKRIAIEVPVGIVVTIEEGIEAEVVIVIEGVAITITVEVVGIVVIAPTVAVTLKNKSGSYPRLPVSSFQYIFR